MSAPLTADAPDDDGTPVWLIVVVTLVGVVVVGGGLVLAGRQSRR